MKFNREISELEENASLWWPEILNEKNAEISIIPKLINTQDDFLKILSLSKDSPTQVFDLIEASNFPSNIFLKHLSVLADYGGEKIQRLGRSFSDIFQVNNNSFYLNFIWNKNEYLYQFETLPIKGLSNKKLFIDGEGLTQEKGLSGIYRDMIILLLFGSTSDSSEDAELSCCEIGEIIGKTEELERYVKERYIHVSKITSGAKSNSLGQLAQKEIVNFLKEYLGESYAVTSNGSILLVGYEKPNGMPFDIVVEKNNSSVGIEISFQVTTNSTIERKSGQSAERMQLMHSNGHKIAYVIDGAGNFQRRSAVSTICSNSDCTVAYKPSEFVILAEWIRESLP